MPTARGLAIGETISQQERPLPNHTRVTSLVQAKTTFQRPVMTDHPPADRSYQLLVSREDRRYHAVLDREIFVLADPARTVLPPAVCGRGGCEPYDESRMPQPQACDECFPWLRANAPDATCIGAPRRNIAERSDTARRLSER